MDEKIAQALLQSLLARLDVDARRENPQFESVISGLERQALRSILKLSGGEPKPVEVRAIPPPRAPEVPVEEVEEPHACVETVEESSPVEKPEPVLLTPGPPAAGFTLDETDLSTGEPALPGHVLCLDFGTAKSKAMAATVGDEGQDPQLLDIGLGRRDDDIDRSAYTVTSSVWISDEGLVFVGSEALYQSIGSYYGGSRRRRLDSLKQQLTLVGSQQNLAMRRLEPEANPTNVDLTYEDIVTFFLGYVTDLALSDLTGGPVRNVKRRFTIPAWQPSQRSWAASALARYVARAQLLADTFRGHWKNGIPADQVKAMARAAARHDNELKYLLDGSEWTRSFPIGLLEPLAAGSGRVWADKAVQNLVLLVDVGAGTTDFSLFWVAQNPATGTRRAIPISPGGDAVRMAGDMIDGVLLDNLLSRVQGGVTSSMRSNIEIDLRLRGLRRLKEQMFSNGRLELSLINDQAVAIELEEFLRDDRVKAVGQEIEKAVSQFLASVDVTWRGATDDALIVLTGGSARLPMIQAMQDRPWKIAGRPTVFKPTREVPEFIASTFDTDFQREYPQLAVAIGGALPIIDEKDMLVQWKGGASSPGPPKPLPGTGV
jgi:molecular chaperone HscA